MIERTIFPNGLRLITIPHRDAKTVTVFLLVGTGSKYEPKELNGVSHFVEHMLFKGTKKRPSALHVAEVLDRVGGSYNAFTGEDSTGYYAKVDAAHFHLALEWVSDIVLHSLLPALEIEKEKGVVSEEINMYRDNPASHVQSVWTRLLYGDQPAGRDIAGTKESVNSFTRDQLLGYWTAQYGAANTVIAIAGPVTKKECEEAVWKLFGAMNTHMPLGKPPVNDSQERCAVSLEFRKTDQTHLAVGGRGFPLFSSKRYIQGVLATVLGGMMSSRLFTNIREDLGLAYYVSTSSDADPDTGSVVTFAGVKNAEAARAVREIVKEYRAMAEHLLSPSELKKAKDNLWGRLVLSLESSDAQAGFYATQELIEGRVFGLDEVYDTIQAVRAGDVREVAKAVFQSAHLNLALVGPFTDTAAFETVLSA
ncbi:MAG: insulinase family protein [Candidatus Wildermuthbacteria bacterium]|nr:insulinase family protein [Candidatus Wildermuthbacteria bacterium]